MQKIYLLLRSNKQAGPYSLEELLQLNLKPFDLIWVEGRSAAWQYPFEIPALQPYVPETPRAEAPSQPIATEAMEAHYGQREEKAAAPKSLPGKVFVSVPKTYRTPQAPVQNDPKPEQPIPAYSRPATTYPAQKPVEEKNVQTNYSRSLDEVEEDYTRWVYQQKTKKRAPVSSKDLVIAGLIIAIIGGGYYVMSRPSITRFALPPKKTEAQIIEQPTENTAEASGSVLQQNAHTTPGEAEAQTINTVSYNGPVKNTKQKDQVATNNPNSPTVRPVQNSMPVEKTTTNIPDDNAVNSKEPATKPQVENKPVEKKKKFGDVIRGIFSKKEQKEEGKKEDVVLDDPRPANNRQAAKRSQEDEPSSGSAGQLNTAALAEQVDLYSNSPENWMMGVRNLKITLRNRSNVGIASAAVAVNYYNENNELLEKKTIYFTNVAPKAKLSVSAPDHKWADHVDYKLISVTPRDDRYASQK